MEYAPIRSSKAQREDQMLQARRQRNSMAHYLQPQQQKSPTSGGQVLPSLQSLNLLTPPNSAEQKHEDNWPAAKADADGRDFLVQSGDALPYTNGRLFSRSASSSPSSAASVPHHVSHFSQSPIDRAAVTLKPISGCANQSVLPKMEVPFRHYESAQRASFEQAGVQEPSIEDRALCADFFLSIKNVERSASPPARWASTPTQTSGLPSRRSRDALQPVSTNSQLSGSPGPFAHYQPRSSVSTASVSPRSELLKPVDFSGDEPHSARKRKMAIPRAAPHPARGDSEASPTAKRRRNQSTGSSRRRASSESFTSGARQQKHVRGKPSKQRRSTNYLDYPDFAPSTSVMVNPLEAAKNVKFATFKDQLDFSKDAHRDVMHEAEIIAATRCHLNGAQYLCTKRQIFEAYVQHLKGERKGNWNKTAAQLVAGIDVQKSSKLWQFFQDVGWFDQAHYKDLP